MANSKSNPAWDDVVRSVTYDEVVGHLEKKGALQPCAACGTNDWIIIMDHDADAPALMQLTNSRNSAQAYWQFAAACTNCGNMRLFHANFVAGSLRADDGSPR